MNFSRSHEIEDCKQKRQRNINLVQKRIKINCALTVDQNYKLYIVKNNKIKYYNIIIK